MKVFKAIIQAIKDAILRRDAEEIGSIDFKTGKVIW